MIATQDYGWSQLALHAGLDWPAATDWAMRQARAAGLRAWEPLVSSVADVRRIGALAGLHGLEMPSIFLTGPLHEEIGTTIPALADIARAGVEFGCTRALIYPSPVPGTDKSDPQLATQARQLNGLAHALSAFGVHLLYHPEDGEMRHAAREFHHMLQATDPALVGLCLDPDTVWRGAGFSELAVHDIIRLYGGRIGSVHLRQSRGKVWDEVFGPGDLDYPGLMTALAEQGAAPDLVIELAYEAATPATLSPEGAHRQSLDYVTRHLLPCLRA